MDYVDLSFDAEEVLKDFVNLAAFGDTSLLKSLEDQRCLNNFNFVIMDFCLHRAWEIWRKIIQGHLCLAQVSIKSIQYSYLL